MTFLSNLINNLHAKKIQVHWIVFLCRDGKGKIEKSKTDYSVISWHSIGTQLLRQWKIKRTLLKRWHCLFILQAHLVFYTKTNLRIHLKATAKLHIMNTEKAFSLLILLRRMLNFNCLKMKKALQRWLNKRKWRSIITHTQTHPWRGWKLSAVVHHKVNEAKWIAHFIVYEPPTMEPLRDSFFSSIWFIYP